jgi:pyridoxamine 5'-phosphate oxidase
VPSRQHLEERLAEMKRRYGDAPPRPPHWGGYRLVPQCLEFWQGRANRLHDRLVYRTQAGGWSLQRLAP